MNSQNRRLPRLQRICRLEESRLNPMVVELIEITSQLYELQQQVSEIKRQLHATNTLDRCDTLQNLLVRNAWAESLQRQLSHLNGEIKSKEQLRNESIYRLASQKSKVRGWESLIDNWRSAIRRESETHESILATDLFLRKYSNGQQS